jgi:hypothetical protein
MDAEKQAFMQMKIRELEEQYKIYKSSQATSKLPPSTKEQWSSAKESFNVAQPPNT